MAASEDAVQAVDLTAGEHRVKAAVVTDEAFELGCSCGWATSSPSGIDILDAWADHCIRVGPSVVKEPDVARRLVVRRRVGSGD